MYKKILMVVFLLVVLGLIWLRHFGRSLSADHDAADYRSRMEFIWPGTPPFQPSAEQKIKISADKNWIIRFLQLFTDTPGDKPYLVAFPLLDGVHPAMIIMPGGAYLLRSEQNEGIDIAHWLNSIGISAFVLNYRLERDPAPLSDAQRAIQYVRANAERFKVDPKRLGVMGFSAGGHLAATASNNILAATPDSPDPILHVSSRPTVMVLGYPVISFGQLGHVTSRDMLIGTNPPVALIKHLSAEKNVTADTPPTFIWAAKTDKQVDYRNSQMLADALARHSIPYELHLFPEGQHGSGLAKNEQYAAEWPSLCKSWMQKIGFLDTKLN
jgi:acetyl esterase/lipase